MAASKLTAPKRAIYPGTFDPITNGHLDVISRAARLFDEVIVVVAKNSSKTPLFSDPERASLCSDAIHEALPNESHITVDSFDGLLAEYARSKEAVAVVRGLRALSDFDYEFQMSLMNRKLEDITTVFLMPHERYTYLNSTVIRELARYRRDVSGFVPNCVQEALHKKFS